MSGNSSKLLSAVENAFDDMTKGRFPALDWLRAVAIIVVVLAHANTTIVPGGAVGVSVFFVISGYIIANILMQDNFVSFKGVIIFYIRRFVRIYPMYILSITVLCLFFYIKDPATLDKVLPYIGNILTFTGLPPEWVGLGFGVLWTLEAEFWFYITFPALLFLGIFLKSVYLIFLLVMLISLAAKIFGIFGFGGVTLIYYDHFLMGALAFIFCRNSEKVKWVRQWVIFVGVGLVLLAITFPYPGARNLVWYTQSLIAALGTSLILIYLNIYPTSLKFNFLSYVGRISYSVYIMHAVLLTVFSRFVNNIPLYIMAVLIVSTITFYFVEQPFSKLIHRKTKYFKVN